MKSHCRLKVNYERGSYVLINDKSLETFFNRIAEQLCKGKPESPGLLRHDALCREAGDGVDLEHIELTIAQDEIYATHTFKV